MLRAFHRTYVPIEKIQIFGERCSGTNFLETLLRQHLPADMITWDYGWKHWFRIGKTAVHDPHSLFLVLYRHPVQWLQSFHKTPWHAGPDLRNQSFPGFIRREWYSIYDENTKIRPGDPLWHTDIPGDLDPETGKRFRNVIAMRNAKVKHFESLRERFDNVCYLRYEDLRADPETSLRLIAARYGLVLPREFVPVGSYKGSGDTFTPRTYAPLTWQDRLFVLHQLDLRQEHAIGYDLLSVTQGN